MLDFCIQARESESASRQRRIQRGAQLLLLLRVRLRAGVVAIAEKQGLELMDRGAYRRHLGADAGYSGGRG